MIRKAYIAPEVSVETLIAENSLLTATQEFYGELGSRETPWVELDINDPLTFVGLFGK